MKTLACMLLAALSCAAQDGGGRDVRVALFTTQPVRVLRLSAAGPDAWTAHCPTCAREPLRGAIDIHPPEELWAGGAVRARDVDSHAERVATGLWHVRAAKDATIDVVLTLPSERMVEAALAGETSAGEPAESLRAMAVVARTFVLNGPHYAGRAGHLAAEQCDSTACMAMALGSVRAEVAEAVRATAGETLWFGARRAEVYFGQSCGGVTEDVRALWPAARNAPYLRSHADPYCLRRDPAKWHAEVSLDELLHVAQAEGWKLPRSIAAVEVRQRTGSGRAAVLAFRGTDGDTARVAAPSLRMGVGRALGWNRVRSDLYEVRLRGATLVFDGRGGGHGVGLCQVGTAEMAREGKSAAEILGFYFAGTRVGVLATDHGWSEEPIGAVRVRSAVPLTAAERIAISAAWADAQRLFGAPGTLQPELVLAPSAEMFRQLTSQPGWTLASTRGARTVVQPPAVLAANHAALLQLLRHEFLHALVETASSDRTPLWLREGFVEMLAGERGEAPMMTAAAVEQGLRSPGSLREAERAHRAAEARVEPLVKRFGMTTVRGWLRSGVPAGVVTSFGS